MSQCVNSQNRGACAHQALKPAWRKSFTTSWVVGASPSDPPPCRNPNNEAANALAAAQHRSPAHLSLHACSAPLLRKKTGSHLARAFARRDRNSLVSSDHRPPTSPARTTNRALQRGLTSSGLVLSFLRLAATKTAPSTWAARGCAEPSQCKADTSVVSTASWAPPNKGNPSAKISIRLLSSGSGSAKSKSRNMPFVTTLPPASLQMRAPALSTANPRRPKNPALAHAARWWPKNVERTATPTLTCGEGGGGEDGAEGGLGTMATQSE